MSSFDFDQYGEEPPQHTALSTEANQALPPSPVALAILGVGAAALLASGATAVPGMIENFRSAAIVQQRLDGNGTRILSRDEAESLVRDAIPILGSDGKLLSIGWEEVRNNKNYKGGTWLVKTGVVYKATVGAGTPGESLAATGHAYGEVRPKLVAQRVQQYLKETNGGL